MVNSSCSAAAHIWAARSRPGDTWRSELARFASQNERESPHKRTKLSDAAFRAQAGGIAQLVERRLCKPNVAGSSPTASTNARFARGRRLKGASRRRSSQRLAACDLRLATKRGRVAQLVRASH